MLHIRWKCRFQLENAVKSMENGQNMLQTVANTVENTMENERFELKTVAHTVEMAVSSSKMLQIAWKMVRTGNPKKTIPNKKKNQTISYPWNIFTFFPTDFCSSSQSSVDLGSFGRYAEERNKVLQQMEQLQRQEIFLEQWTSRVEARTEQIPTGSLRSFETVALHSLFRWLYGQFGRELKFCFFLHDFRCKLDSTGM